MALSLTGCASTAYHESKAFYGVVRLGEVKAPVTTEKSSAAVRLQRRPRLRSRTTEDLYTLALQEVNDRIAGSH